MKRFTGTFLIFALLTIVTAQLAAQPRPASTVVGDWEGHLDTGGKVFQVLLHVRIADNGKLTATADNISQDELDIPVDVVKFAAPGLHLEIQGGAGIYDGVVDGKALKIVGDWKQGGATYPLHFARVTDEYVRTVTPKRLRVAFVIS